MTSQEQDRIHTDFGLPSARGQTEHSNSGYNDSELGLSASNRAVTVTLVIGIGLILFVLFLPYLSDL